MVRLFLLAIVGVVGGCNTAEDSSGMGSDIAGHVVADCGSFQCDRTEKGGLIVHDGDVTILIGSYSEYSTLEDLAWLRNIYLQNSQREVESGRRSLPEAAFAAGDNTGFKYAAVDPKGKTVGVAYLLQAEGGCVQVQIGTVGEPFDEREYEESVLQSIRFE